MAEARLCPNTLRVTAMHDKQHVTQIFQKHQAKLEIVLSENGRVLLWRSNYRPKVEK